MNPLVCDSARDSGVLGVFGVPGGSLACRQLAGAGLMSTALKRLAPILLLCGLVLAACGGSDAPRADPSPPRGPVTYRTGVDPVSVAITGGFAWVANAGEGTVSRIDLRSGRSV